MPELIPRTLDALLVKVSKSLKPIIEVDPEKIARLRGYLMNDHCF
jgi:hypothetical protein